MLCRDCDLFRFPFMKTTSDKATVPANKTAAVTATPIMQSGTDQSTAEFKIVVNELLFFVNNKFDCLARDIICSIVADFFRDVLLVAKQILVQHLNTCQSDTIQSPLKKRIGETK